MFGLLDCYLLFIFIYYMKCHYLTLMGSDKIRTFVPLELHL